MGNSGEPLPPLLPSRSARTNRIEGIETPMNAATRKYVAAQLASIYADNGFQDIADQVQQLADDEREKYDNIEAEFGENAPQLEALEEASDTLEEASSKLEEAAQLADEAADLLSTIAGA